jgi:macrolide transport system ATP-binding/permease protein
MRDNNTAAYRSHGDRVQASISSRIRNARHRLDVLLADPVRKPPAQLRFTGSLGREASGDAPVLAARDLDVPGRLRLPMLEVPADGRLLVTGPNGAGKSTLLSVLAGVLPTSVGWVWRRRGLRVALLEQDVTFAAGRADQPPVAGARRGPRGGPAHRPRRDRRGQPRPVAAPPLGRRRAPASRSVTGGRD